MIQITVPMEIAPIIPCAPVSPESFRTSVANRSVAIDIPETGLLLLPTRPTILDETAPKKNPNNAIRIAPTSDTGI